ncbi:NIPSNAP family protein [Kribbella sp. NPDC058693]|uniref:NIPSNAP family protein n=1 Tax=Kribbella sp. NPDC058693 TaxID=3346602 RepID=UPI00364D43AB
MYQLRIYTLRTAEALREYATVHWPRHIPSLREFGVTTHGIWTDHNAGAHRLIALIAYADGAEPADVTAAYMASPEFAADMQGFDVSNILNVEELLLDPTSGSPLS